MRFLSVIFYRWSHSHLAVPPKPNYEPKNLENIPLWKPELLGTSFERQSDMASAFDFVGNISIFVPGKG